MNPASLLGACLIGLSLGLTGAGGSIITLPVLVYLAGMSPAQAVGPSLFVVGAAAWAGALLRMRAGEFHTRAALLFGSAGMAGAVGGARLTPLVDGRVLLLIFALLMVAVATAMLLGGKGEVCQAEVCQPARCLAAGLGVGILTGFIGVGGGFLLVPALVKFGRLSMRAATGTSLAVIGFNSAAGFLSHWNGGHQPWLLMTVFAALATAGVLGGARLASHLPVPRLRQGFAVLVLLTGGFVLWQNLAG